MQTKLNIIKAAFESLFDPEKTIDDLKIFFSEDYTQWVDNKVLNYSEFLKHIAMLKKNIQSAKIHFIDFIESDRTAADIHDIYAIKYNGESIYTRVIAFYTFDNNKITSIRELTQLIKGNPADDDMGSRF